MTLGVDGSTGKETLDGDNDKPATNVDPANPEALQHVSDLPKQGCICPYHDPFPFLSAQGKYEMILSTSRWPDGCHFSKARSEGKVAEDAKDEAVDEGYGTARGENKADGASEGNPSTTHRSVIKPSI